MSLTEYRIFGPPGTGKTTWLSGQVKGAALSHGPARLLVASFTRTAAVEITARLREEFSAFGVEVDSRQVGTLHSLGYGLLGRPPIAEKGQLLSEWNSSVRDDYRQSDSKRTIDDPMDDCDMGGELMGDQSRKEIEILRAKMVPPDKWPPRLQGFWKRWCEFKLDTGSVDFTDMIERPLKEGLPAPGNPKVIFCDETQDHSPLELALLRKWASYPEVEKLVIAGDDDQCHPAGTMILAGGKEWIPIEELDPNFHRLMSYDRRGSAIVGYRRGYPFEISSRHYDGWLYSVRCAGHVLTATENHKWLVQWTDEAKKPELHVVYLMRRGDLWRVGWCRLFRSDGVLHLGHRALKEKADAVWILKFCKDRTDASITESAVSVIWGIPTIMFEPVEGAFRYTRESIKELFDIVTSETSLTTNAIKCLIRYGRNVQFPLWSPHIARTKRGGTSTFIVHSSNLSSEYMKIPVYCGDLKKVPWLPVDRVEKTYKEDQRVWSLSVKPHELYIANNLVTHNSIYSFRGCRPEAFLDPPIPREQIRILQHSYRLPRNIKNLATRWIEQVRRRQEKDFESRDSDGEILYRPQIRLGDPVQVRKLIETYESAGSVMVLASCGYMLKPILRELRFMGIPFHNPYREKHPPWNPLRGGVDKLKAYLHTPWTWATMNQWLDIVDTKKAKMVRGAKKGVSILAKTEASADNKVGLDDLRTIFKDLNGTVPWEGREVKWLKSVTLASKAKIMAYAFNIVEKRGREEVFKDPKIVTGTVHSVKGGQATTTILFPDLSGAGDEEYLGKGRDSVLRVFYVGMTRSFERLILCGQEHSERHVIWMR